MAIFEAKAVVNRPLFTAFTPTRLFVPYGATYYLSPDSPGELTTMAPSADGHVVAAIGKALTTETLSIEIGTTILL